MMSTAIEVSNLSKIYDNGFNALSNINFSVNKGEIFALLGPNGAGKSTLINIICGITKKNSGLVNIFDFDNIKDYKSARSLIGLVPQEIATDSFEKVINALKFSRGLFNKPRNNAYLERILSDFALFDKKEDQIRTLSGGMKRRLLIAKALSHEPKILFLDEPTAGVDVELRKTLWKNLVNLKNKGITIFLTTHYIEEAEKLADRVAIIDKGKITLIESKQQLISKFGKKKIVIKLKKPIHNIPEKLSKYNLLKNSTGKQLIYSFNSENFIDVLLSDINKIGLRYDDLEVRQKSLEEIFIDLVKK